MAAKSGVEQTVSRRAKASQFNGRLGGVATAKKGPEFCETRAQKAGSACLAKYGSDFYAHIRSLRKTPVKKPKIKVAGSYTRKRLRRSALVQLTQQLREMARA